MNTKDILTRLQNGEDAQKIANEFATMLNDAVAQQKKAKEDEIQKQEKLQNAVDEILDWLDTYYPEFKTETVNLDAADIIKVLDESKDSIVELIKTTKELFELVEGSDSIIESFLKANHLF